MAYTAYKFKPSFVEKRLKSYKSNLMKFKGHDNLVVNAVRVIRERLEADPRRYLSYGPYWWGIKKVLVDNGVPLGECDDEEIRLADRRGDHRDGRGVQPNPPGTLASNDMDHPPDA
ncbi:hypothetical protein HMPREF3036_00536 [Sutterella sp. KLE1602]|uniref:hypothetical protein n=1 Tax=Sutterella sp. KLE1602 TaxID=1574262 RepID=UPI0007852EEC|nr:hypothetical protein [Sutterella sp. KLE1602]KXT38029.1 hypothetical protein HMPREF3036_00536 [Sutterella sp. KLE1602]